MKSHTLSGFPLLGLARVARLGWYWNWSRNACLYAGFIHQTFGILFSLIAVLSPIALVNEVGIMIGLVTASRTLIFELIGRSFVVNFLWISLDMCLVPFGALTYLTSTAASTKGFNI